MIFLFLLKCSWFLQKCPKYCKTLLKYTGVTLIKSGQAMSYLVWLLSQWSYNSIQVKNEMIFVRMALFFVTRGFPSLDSFRRASSPSQPLRKKACSRWRRHSPVPAIFPAMWVVTILNWSNGCSVSKAAFFISSYVNLSMMCENGTQCWSLDWSDTSALATIFSNILTSSRLLCALYTSLRIAVARDSWRWDDKCGWDDLKSFRVSIIPHTLALNPANKFTWHSSLHRIGPSKLWPLCATRTGLGNFWRNSRKSTKHDSNGTAWTCWPR